MNIEQTLVEKLRRLSPEKQREVLDFVDFLHKKSEKKAPLSSPKGLWANLGIDISEADIAEARREMWGNFPDEDISWDQ
ncbi:MAG: DUF2281 domain-containing protein [Deltaproteobacteria bacterium]|nr:DUF2281 domain-containing protein [Deltaproteobacteria bacterium]MBW1920179.1 DUF2281 domain-containing protein [Deltaproteobacteria bacterium]